MYQGISEQLGELDNIVELRRMALPSLPFGPRNQDAEALLTLKHRLAITGPRTLQITFVGTDVSLQGGRPSVNLQSYVCCRPRSTAAAATCGACLPFARSATTQ